MSKLDWLVAILIGGGFLLTMFAADRQLRVLIATGLFFMGIGLLGGSATAVLNNRVGFWPLRWVLPNTVHGIYSGFWGVILFLSGGALLILAGERAFSDETAFLDLLLRRPGVVLLAGGLVPMVIGIPQVFTPIDRQAGCQVLLNQIGRRLRGLVLLVLGMGMGLIGIYEIFFPNAFDEFINSILGPFGPGGLIQ